MVWVVVVISALVFLLWFGNYTAAKYRHLFGSLPPVHEPKKYDYGQELKVPRTMVDYDYCSSAVSTISVTTCVSSPYMGFKIIR